MRPPPPWLDRAVAWALGGALCGIGGTMLVLGVRPPLALGVLSAAAIALALAGRHANRAGVALGQLIDAAPDAVLVADERGRIRRANLQAQTLFGHTAREFEGMDLKVLMPEADAARHDGYMAEHGRGRRAMTAEGRDVMARRRDGSEVAVHVRVTRMIDAGEPVFVGFVRDMSERRRAEAALRHSEDKLRKLYAMSPLGIALTDMSGRFLDFNDAFVALTGHEAAALHSLSYWDLTPIEFAAQEAANLEALQTTGRYGPYEKDYVGPGGARRPVRLNGVRILLDGEPCIWSIVEDLTEHRRAEQEHERLQRQLMQAQKMEALGQLTGGIAHNFNNMLAGILGLSTLALERHVDAPDSRLATYLREIVRVGERGRELVGRLMSFSRPAAAQPLAPRAVAPVVDEVVGMLAPAMPAALQLSQRSAPALPEVSFSDVDLHQVVANLVINARDAVDGCGEVVVELAAVDADGCECTSCGRLAHGPHLALRVHDSGGGIPPELRARIFEPFFTTKDVGKGTGLGLATVHTLVHHMGGHVTVQARPEGGTTFELLLPAATGAPAAPAGAPPGAESHVWIVDEDPVMRHHLEDMVRAAGHAVRAFGDARRAIDALCGGTPPMHHLVTDIGSQGPLALELTCLARAVRPDVNVVWCSSLDGPPDALTARLLGQQRWLRKPIAPAALATALQRGCTAPRAVEHESN